MMRNNSYKPLFNHPYVIIRKKDKNSFTPWSTPDQLSNVKSNDLTTLNKIKDQLSKPELDSDDSGKVRLKLTFPMWNHVFGSYPRERTEIRLCLPAGTVFAAINV